MKQVQASSVFEEVVDRLREAFPKAISIHDCRGVPRPESIAYILTSSLLHADERYSAGVIGREKAFPILRRLLGKDFVIQFAAEVPFQVNPLAFFQTNTYQTGQLVDMVYNAASRSLLQSHCILSWILTSKL